MISIIQTIVLSIVQGITEWLPISSSGHLAIFQNIFGFQSLPFDVFLHFASIFAVIIVFWKDLVRMLNLRKKNNLKYIFFIIIGIIPAGIVGFLFREQIAGFFSSIFYLGIFFIISGLIVYSTKFFLVKRDKINFLDSIFIGIFQAIAVLPGISRSGATISSGIFRGLNKEQAAKFSFFMAIPIILGASLLEFKNIAFTQISIFVLVLSFIITLVVSILVIKLLLKIIKSDNFYLFGIYNMILGLFLILYTFII